MLENAAQKAGIAYLHGAVLAREGLVRLDKPAGRRFERLFIRKLTMGLNPSLCLPDCLRHSRADVFHARQECRDGEEHSPVLHLDLSVPEIEGFDG